MKIDEWKFEDRPDVMVMTTKNIINRKNSILSVWHDAEDEMWQFLDGTDIDDDYASLVILEYMVNIDKSINDIADLKLGWVAWREKKDIEWRRQKIEE